MKTVLSILVASLAITSFSHADVRKFKDTTGKEIWAELLAVRGENVTMEVGGKEFTLPIARFSEEDVTYIKEWGVANPAPPEPINVRGLYVEFDKNMERLEGSKPDPDAKKKGPEISKTMFEYEITIRNTSPQELSDMKVSYTLYKTYRDRHADGSSSSGMEETEGEESIATLGKSSDHTFVTQSVITTDSKTEGKKDEDGSSHSESMLGVVARVYVGGSEVRVASYPDGLDQRIAALKDEDDD